MKTQNNYYLIERHNPQFEKPYYIACGKLARKDARRKETPIYGTNYVHAYETEQAYNEAIEKAKSDGFSVR